MVLSMVWSADIAVLSIDFKNPGRVRRAHGGRKISKRVELQMPFALALLGCSTVATLPFVRPLLKLIRLFSLSRRSYSRRNATIGSSFAALAAG